MEISRSSVVMSGVKLTQAKKLAAVTVEELNFILRSEYEGFRYVLDAPPSAAKTSDSTAGCSGRRAEDGELTRKKNKRKDAPRSAAKTSDSMAGSSGRSAEEGELTRKRYHNKRSRGDEAGRGGSSGFNIAAHREEEEDKEQEDDGRAGKRTRSGIVFNPDTLKEK
jgi:hypothetical protein